MADVKLEVLGGAPATTMAAGDLIPFTSDPRGTPISKNITKENLGIYLIGIRFGTNIAPQLRRSRIVIENGTDAAHIKVTMTNEGNGDANAVQDNIGKDGVTTGVWSLNAGGNVLTLLNAGITGDALLPIGCSPYFNLAGTAMNVYVQLSGGFLFNFYNAATGAVLDLTTLVDTGALPLSFVYLTTV